MDIALAAISFLIGVWFATAVHEAGHLFFARLFDFSVLKVTIGCGPLLFRLDAFQTSIYFRAMPSGGAVFLYPYIRDRKYASLLFTIGGLIANCIMIAILDYFYRHFQSFLDRQSGVVYAFFGHNC
jgi:membrane-associated protease RseP (regulator of RpoE activity)